MASGPQHPSDRPLVLLSQRLGPVTDLERELEAHGAEIRGAPLWSLDEIREHGSEARVIILGAVEPFDAAALQALPSLAAIVRRGVGTDNVDLEAATTLGILVANVPDATVEEVSDHALALLLAVERRITALDAAVRAGSWARDPSAILGIRKPIRRLSTLTLGIVGLGRIGRALARKAAPLYERVLGFDPFLPTDAAARIGVSLVPMHELLARTDHLSLHAPLSAETRNLIDEKTIGRLRLGAVIVNSARGALVDERAVLAAVRDGHIGGAGLDVTAIEPLPPDSPLLREGRILLTAHSAASSTSADAELASRSVAAARAILTGRRPESIANPRVLERPDLRTGQLDG